MAALLFGFLEFGAKRRLITSLFIILLTAFLGLGLQHLYIETTFQNLIPENDPDRVFYDDVRAQFGSDDNAIIYIASDSLWTPDNLALLEEIHYQLEDSDFAEKVDSIFNVTNIKFVDGALSASPVIDLLPDTREEAEKARDLALTNDLLVRSYLSETGDVISLVVSLYRSDPKDTTYQKRIYNRIEEILAPAKDHFEIVTQLGGPRVFQDTKVTIMQDGTLLLPIATLVLVCTIALFLRNSFAVWVPLAPGFISIICTLGAMGWLGLPINSIGVIIPLVIIVVGATEDIHMLTGYYEGLSACPLEAPEERRPWAIRFMAKHVGIPVLLTTVTTFLGFLSNGLHDIVLIRDAAYGMAMGIFFNGLLTILLIPLILRTFGPTKAPVVREKPLKTDLLIESLVDKFIHLKREHPLAILIITVILLSLSVFAGTNLNVKNDPIAAFSSDHKILSDLEMLHDNLSGVEIFYVVLDIEGPGSFKDPKNLALLHQVAETIRQTPEIDKVVSFADQMALTHREWGLGDATEEQKQEKTPQSRDLVDQYLLFFQDRDIEKFISPDFRQANITVRHNVHASDEISEIIEDLKARIQPTIENKFSMKVTGQYILIARAATQLMKTQLESILYLLVVIFIIMSILFTSIIGGLISLIPNVVPIVLMFGCMWLIGLPLNPGTVIVAVVIIGIAVDDTLHLMTRYNHECQNRTDTAAATVATMRAEGRPVVTTSISLIVGFLVFLFADMTYLWHFGLMASIAMFFALIADLLITPIIMSHVRLVSLHDLTTLKLPMAQLSQSPLFEDMSKTEIRKTILLSDIYDFKEGELLIEQGSIGRNMYFILEGAVDVYVPDDENTVMTTLETGGIVGEIGFVSEQKRTASIVAKTDGRALVFSTERVARNTVLYPKLRTKIYLNIGRILSARLGQVLTRLGTIEKVVR